MIQMRAFSVLASMLAATSLLGGGTQSQGQLQSIVKNPIQREPIVMFDVSGSTFLGPVLEHLTIYNDGLASYSNASPTGSTSVGSAMISSQEINKLIQALEEANAGTLQDQEGTVSDVPLTTVTLFSGGTNAQAHTYSYWLGWDNYAAADDVLSEFIEVHFTTKQ